MRTPLLPSDLISILRGEPAAEGDAPGSVECLKRSALPPRSGRLGADSTKSNAMTRDITAAGALGEPDELGDGPDASARMCNGLRLHGGIDDHPLPFLRADGASFGGRPRCC